MTELAEPAVKKDSIRDFITAWRSAAPTVSYAQVKTLQDTITWDRRFQEAGYHCVELSRDNRMTQWHDIRNWCTQQFGEEHYAWTGTSVFWFECQRDAMWFTLKWS